MQCSVTMATHLKSLPHWTVMNKITLYSFIIAAHNLNGALLHLTMCFSHSGHSCMNALYICDFTHLVQSNFDCITVVDTSFARFSLLQYS